MFVPRALRLKGVREPQRPKAANATVRPRIDSGPKDPRNQDDALVYAMQKTSTTSPAPEPEQTHPKMIKGPRFTTKPVTPEYIAQLAAGIDLIFTDYAHQEEGRNTWLRSHYRTLNCEEKYIHLTAILEHPNISSLKPEASQVLLQQALQSHPSEILEVSSNGYYIRRKPASYPPKYLPRDSFEVFDDNGLAFWDQRTIYVEPHLRNICQTPAKVAHWLKENGQLRPKWLPIQAVHMLWNSCAFVVLSGSVMHNDVWQKWKDVNKPDDWKTMTKVEHTKRTAEYVAILEKQNPKGMRKIQINDSELPAIARPAVLRMDVETVPQYSEATEKTKGKRKRKKKTNKFGLLKDDVQANISNDAADDTEEHEPSRKRRA